MFKNSKICANDTTELALQVSAVQARVSPAKRLGRAAEDFAGCRFSSSCVISPLAVIASAAKIGENVTIGAFSVIGPSKLGRTLRDVINGRLWGRADVTLGDGVRLHSHVVIQGNPRTRLLWEKG
jgi:UDP-3-O-[3-hydroxymyristoyl] glucosamine N-acyltransferase